MLIVYMGKVLSALITLGVDGIGKSKKHHCGKYIIFLKMNPLLKDERVSEFTLVSPNSQVYFIDSVPKEDLAKLPTMFSTKYHDEPIPEFLLLRDPFFNKHPVRLFRRSGKAYLGDGWRAVGSYYGLNQGGWIRLSVSKVVCGFDINVYDQSMHEIFYPMCSSIPLLPTYEKALASSSGSKPKGVDGLSNPEKQKLVLDELCSVFPYHFQKEITQQDLETDVLLIKMDFARKALPKVPSDVTLVGECGQEWKGFLNFDAGRGEYCGVMGCWGRVCFAKNFKVGQTVAFGVASEHSNIIYFTRI